MFQNQSIWDTVRGELGKLDYHGADQSASSTNTPMPTPEVKPMQMGFGDHRWTLDPNLQYDDSAVKPWHVALMDKWSKEGNAFKTVRDRMRRAREGGEDYFTQHMNDDNANKQNTVAQINADPVIANLPDEQYKLWLKKQHQELGAGPQMPQYSAPQAPNLAQSGLAFLASMLDKQHAFDIAATPFLSNTQQNDQDYARRMQQYQLQEQAHQRKLGYLQDMTQTQSQRDITQANLQNQGLDRETQQRGQDITLSRAMWTDLNASDSVPRLKASIAAIEGSGIPLPKNWADIKLDLVKEAEQRQTEKDSAKKSEATEKLIQKYLGMAGNPNLDGNARVMNGQIAAMMMDDGDPRHGYLEQILPGLGKLTLKNKKDQAEISHLFTKDANDTKMTEARILESKERRRVMQSVFNLNNTRADNIEKATSWMDREKAMTIAKGYATIDGIKSLIEHRNNQDALGMLQLDQKGWVAANSSIGQTLSTLSAQANTLRAERSRLEVLQQNYSPDDQEYKDIQKNINAIDGTITNLSSQYKEVKDEALKIRDRLRSGVGGKQDDGNPKATDVSGFMKQWAGTPYKWGGNGKDGIDCSAFATKMLHQVYGCKASGNTTTLMKQGMAVSPAKKDLQPGDLIFFRSPKGVQHVIVYTGNGMTSEASSSKGVVSRPLSDERFDSAIEVRRYR